MQERQLEGESTGTEGEASTPGRVVGGTLPGGQSAEGGAPCTRARYECERVCVERRNAWSVCHGQLASSEVRSGDLYADAARHVTGAARGYARDRGRAQVACPAGPSSKQACARDAHARCARRKLDRGRCISPLLAATRGTGGGAQLGGAQGASACPAGPRSGRGRAGAPCALGRIRAASCASGTMWPPRPRGHWRRPACRRRRRRGCSEAWLISAVGSIEALVRLESLYDTLTTHRRLPAERTETTRTSPQTTALSGPCQVLRSLTDRNRTSPTEQ